MRRQIKITQEQFDNATAEFYEHVTGKTPGDDFPGIEYDPFFVVARIVLEGAGVKVP